MKNSRKMRRALRMCIEFMHTGEIQPDGERHPFSLWYAAITSGEMALGQRLKRGGDGKLRWRLIKSSSPAAVRVSRGQDRRRAGH
jgi:hypothetical protein